MICRPVNVKYTWSTAFLRQIEKLSLKKQDNPCNKSLTEMDTTHLQGQLNATGMSENPCSVHKNATRGFF